MVPLHFTVEFLGFLVAAGAALLVLTRPTLVPGSAFNRATVALGFAILAAAEVLHGGGFDLFGADPAVQFQNDGAQVLVTMRALAFAFMLIGIGGAKENVTSAAAAFSLREPLLLAPAASAFLLAIISLVGSAREGLSVLRRLSLAGVLFAASEVMTASAPRATFGTGQTDPFALGAHGLKAAAFLAMAGWLWAGVRSSIRTRFVASFVSLLVLVVLVLSSALTAVISNNVEENEFRRVASQAAAAIDTLEGQEVQEVFGKAEQIAGLENTAPLLANGSQADLASGAAELLQDEFIDEDFLIFTDPSGDLLAHAGENPELGHDQGEPEELTPLDAVKVIGSGVVQDVADGGSRVATGIDQIDVRSIAIIAAVRVTTETQGPVGIVVLGRYIDAQNVDEISANLAPAKATMIVGKRLLATSLPGRPKVAELLPPLLRDELELVGTAVDQQSFGSRSYYSSFQFIEAPNGDPVATLVLSAPSSLAAENREGFTRILFVVAMGVAIVALVLAYLFGRRITRPIQMLTDAAGAVREGDLNVQAQVEGDDEVGQLGETFNEMTASLSRMTTDLRDSALKEHDLRTRIETIIQSMADGLVAVDADLNVLAFNSAAEQLTGIKKERAEGRPIEKVLDARDSQGEPIALPIYGLAPGSVGGVFIHRKKGDPVPITVLCEVLRDAEGEETGGVAVLRDMTREREVERMKSEFLSNISHELRTPLTPIKGYAEIMQRRDLPVEKQQKFVKGILESTGRLERIVQLLVDFSAMEAGRLSPRATPLDLGAIVEEISRDWNERTPKHDFVTDVKAKIPKVVADERLIRRSLEEVIDNAVKFSPRGGQITLEVKPGVSPNGQGDRRRNAVLVSITDEGIGIPEKELTKIFSDFHQLDGSETRTYGGLGLGLAFVQRIVEAHNGSVSVDSRPDKGTKLTIAIPAAKARRKAEPAVTTEK